MRTSVRPACGGLGKWKRMLRARRGRTTRSRSSRAIILRLLWAWAALVFLAPKRSTKRDSSAMRFSTCTFWASIWSRRRSRSSR